MSSIFISRTSGLRQNDRFFDPNSLVSGYETDIGHFLPNQNVISQMNHTAMTNSIWSTNGQSFSYFHNVRFLWARALKNYQLSFILNWNQSVGLRYLFVATDFLQIHWGFGNLHDHL